MEASHCQCKQQPDVDLVAIDRIIDRFGSNRENLIMILQAVQKEYHFLPEEALRYIASKLGVSLSHVYTIATFYSSLSLEPKGRHIIQVCTGTACHLKGSDRVVEDLCRRLNVQPGGTTEDGKFTVETVNCVGACALAMVAVVDEKYYPRTDASGMTRVVDHFISKEGK